ncbi:conserved protein of unknown function [Burkholderia multivorans]
MNPANADYHNLILNYVAPRLVAQGADGFYLDNLEIVEHGMSTTNGPCDSARRQGSRDLVYLLRQKYPKLLIVMQNATSDVMCLGMTNGMPFNSLLDGIVHEEVYQPNADPTAETQLRNWEKLALSPSGNPFWIGTLDYVGTCSNVSAAQNAYATNRSRGFSPYASDASAGQNVVCHWGF